MSSKGATERLKKELKRLHKEPVDLIDAAPDESDLLTWHYCIRGPPDSLYAGGYYHGKVIFPKQYPYKPPSIMMMTPNGRFKVNTRLCLSMSDFHPESWNPLWNVGSILSGVLSFMLETAATYGSMETSDELKKAYAANSLAFNIKDRHFNTLFPQYKQIYAESLKPKPQQISSSSTAAAATATSIDNTDTTPLLQQAPVINIDLPAGAAAAAGAPAAPPTDLQNQINQHQQRGSLLDKLIIVLVVSGIAFLISYLYT